MVKETELKKAPVTMIEDMVTFVKLDNGAEVPEFAHEDDFCVDLKAVSVEYDEKYDMYIYHTGIHIEMPDGIHMIVSPRSSNRKTDAYLANMQGIIDNSYRGEIIVCYKNRTSYEVNCMLAEWKFMKSLTKDINVKREDSVTDYMNTIKENAGGKAFEKPNPMDFAPYVVGDKLAQAYFIEKVPMKLVETDELSDTVRGDGAFGSTGK